jgi:cbb3-type cytochrome oxidase maturation protein
VETIFVLLPLALLIAAIAVGFFIWAARTGQFDDLETPAVRILFDDEEPSPRRSNEVPAPAAASPGPPAPGQAPTTAQPKATAGSTRRVSE